MKLLIDAGNSRIKWCWYDGEDLPLDYQTCEYEDFEAEGSHIFAGEGHDADDVLICNVAGNDVRQGLIKAFAEWQLTPRFFVSQQSCAGVRNAYPSPEKLGVDRWLSLLGAWSIRKDAVCIVDCGTAVTIDVLNDTGQHLGGLITPGIELMQDSLAEATAQIQISEEEHGDPDSPLLANNTTSAIEAGTLYAVVALVERVHQDVARELDMDLPVILTGGDADMLQPLLAGECIHERMLVFNGMIVAEESTSD